MLKSFMVYQIEADTAFFTYTRAQANKYEPLDFDFRFFYLSAYIFIFYLFIGFYSSAHFYRL